VKNKESSKKSDATQWAKTLIKHSKRNEAGFIQLCQSLSKFAANYENNPLISDNISEKSSEKMTKK